MPKGAEPTESEAELGLSRLLSETFEMREGSTGALLQELLHAARLFLGMEIGFISEFEDGRRVFRYVDQAEGVDVFNVGGSDPLERTYCQRIVDGRLPELIDDATEVPEVQAVPEIRELGVRSHVSTPIRLPDGSVYGTFCTFSFWASHELTERDRALMHVFSKIAADLLQQDLDRTRDEEIRRSRIRQLLDDDEFTVVFQPMVEIGSSRIIGVESLARFPREPERGTEDWFAEAESVGLLEELEIRAIEKGLEALPRLPENVYVSCNVSVSSLCAGRFAEYLQSMPLERVVLEITEHAEIEDYAKVCEVVDSLRSRGLRLAVDDAGAGYASFRHILRLQPDIIKLDISLTRDIDTDVARRALAASLVDFAHEIGSRLTAEGVETEGELRCLEQLGVHKAQGYFLYLPLSLDDLVKTLSASRS